ncbi:MAG: DUF1893 domain-containing protein [Bacilli bacterium]
MILEDSCLEKIKLGKSTLIVILNNKVIIDNNNFGVISLVENYDKLKNNYEPLKIYDKLIGKGAAVLISNLNIDFVYAKTITKEALSILENKCIIKYDVVVNNILNRDKSDLCPIEKIASKYDDVNILYDELKSFYIERGFLND